MIVFSNKWPTPPFSHRWLVQCLLFFPFFLPLTNIVNFSYNSWVIRRLLKWPRDQRCVQGGAFISLSVVFSVCVRSVHLIWLSRTLINVLAFVWIFPFSNAIPNQLIVLNNSFQQIGFPAKLYWIMLYRRCISVNNRGSSRVLMDGRYWLRNHSSDWLCYIARCKTATRVVTLNQYLLNFSAFYLLFGLPIGFIFVQIREWKAKLPMYDDCVLAGSDVRVTQIA